MKKKKLNTLVLNKKSIINFGNIDLETVKAGGVITRRPNAAGSPCPRSLTPETCDPPTMTCPNWSCGCLSSGTDCR